MATQFVKSPSEKAVTITPKRVNQYLGVPKFKHDLVEGENEVGVTTGLAWTQNGGELLFTEVCLMKGTGRLQITGLLGDVMKESAQAALSYVRGNANKLGIFSDVFRKTDIHIHIPEGATQKDGPSAGVTIATGLVSAFTGVPVKKRVAMTGEVTLRGKVLPIGGLKEKLLAAKRGQVEEVLIPRNNLNDLTEISNDIKKGLNISAIKTVDEMFALALERMPDPVIDPPGSNEDPGQVEHDEIMRPAEEINHDIPPTIYP